MAAIDILWLILACIGAYLIGAMPFSVWVGKLVKGQDVRNHHTGNPGGMNAIRTFGLGIGLVILFLDIFKGTLVIALMDHLFSFDHFVAENGTNIFHSLACILGPGLCVLGHTYSIFIKFEGGQGLGVFMGVLTYSQPLALMFYLLGFIFLTVVVKLNVRTVGFIIVLLCVFVALLIPIGPPWNNLMTDLAVGPNGFLHLTQGLLTFSMLVVLLTRLFENLIKKTSMGKKRGTEIG